MKKNFSRLASAALFAGAAFVAMPAFSAEVEGWGDFKLYLDPGHAGKENIGLYSYSEAQKTLRVALGIQDFLKQYTDMPEENLKLCRYTDNDQISLEERSDEANAWGADFFYSIHSDASAQVNTIVTLFGGWKLNGELVEKTPNGGKAYGDILEPNLSGVMRIGSRGNRYDREFYMPGEDTHENQFPYLSVNRRTTMASLLSEGGYHTLPEQQARNINDDYKRLESFAAFQSILKYRGLTLPAQTFLTGVVSNSENGQALNGATVKVGDQTYTTDSYESLFNQYTRNPNLIHNGFYVFKDLEAGSTVDVEFSAPGFESTTKQVTIKAGGETSADYVTFLDVALTNASPAKIDAISLTDLNSVSSRYPLVITFSRNMNRQSVEEAFSINNDAEVTLSWDNDYTLNVDLSKLEALWEYTITIDGTKARNSQTNQLLDGDGDGTEGGDYVLTFTMAEPDLTAPEIVGTYPEAEGEALYTKRPPISIQFNEVIDWNEDANSGWFEVKDANGKVYEIGHVSHAIIGDASVLTCYLNEDLASDCAVLVTLKPVKDLSGNETEPIAFRFLTEYRAMTASTMIQQLDSEGDFWAPGGSGSSKGLSEEGNALTTLPFSPYHGINSCMDIVYSFDPDSSDPYWMIRDHNPKANGLTLRGTNGVITMWVYGDNSGNETGLFIRDFSSNGLLRRAEPLTVDFLGWKPFVWDLANDETAAFTGTNPSMKAKWYLDAIYINHWNSPDEAIFDEEEEGYRNWSGEIGYYEMQQSTWDDSAERTASITDIDLPGSGVADIAVANITMSLRGGVLTVSAPEAIRLVTVTAIDGRTELSVAPAAMEAAVSMETLPAGIHIVTVATASGSRTAKIVR